MILLLVPTSLLYIHLKEEEEEEEELGLATYFLYNYIGFPSVYIRMPLDDSHCVYFPKANLFPQQIRICSAGFVHSDIHVTPGWAEASHWIIT